MLKITFNYAKNTICLINLFSYMIRKRQFAIHNYSQVSYLITPKDCNPEIPDPGMTGSRNVFNPEIPGL